MHAQSDGKLDSLLNRLNHPFDSDSLHAIAYEDVIWHYIELADDAKIWAYLDSLRSFGIRASYPYTELLYEFNVGYFYFRESMYDSALVHMHLTADLADKLNYPKQKINALFRIATLLHFQGHLDSAMVILDEAENLARTLSKLELIADAFVEKATVEYDRGNYLEALNFYFQADSLYDQISENKELYHNRTFRRASVLMNIALLHHEQLKNDERALTYMDRSKALSVQDGRLHNLATADLVLARIHNSLGNTSFADSLLGESLAYFRSINHPVQMARAAMLQGATKLRLNQKEAGERLLLEAEALYETLGTPAGLISVHTHLGQFYQKEEKFSQSRNHLRRALSLVASDIDRADLMRDLAYTFSAGGDYKQAFNTLDTSMSLADSLNETQLNEALQESEIKYQTAQREREIVDLKLSQSQQEIKNQRILLLSTIGLLSLLTLSFFYFYRARQKTKVNKQLKELDELKSKLFSDISHEFRTPLALITGPVEMVMNRVADQPDVYHDLKMVSRNAAKLNHLVDSVQNLAKLDAGKMALHIRPGKLKTHLKIIAASFDSMAASKNISFNADIDLSDEFFYYDPVHLETILYNLLSNAFKFTSKGEIKVVANVDHDNIIIKVSDTGIGLSEAQQQKIFNRYYRVDSPQISVEGVGIGLALAHELAKLHLGSLTVTSTLHQGSVFSLSIPVIKEKYTVSGFEIGSEYIPSSCSIQPSAARLVSEAASPLHEDEPIILLVEDNPDMRQHLESLFKKEYSIIQAGNGQEGLAMAQQFVPDIIISDLMMPIMDGQAFLKAVKTDPKTSHIPFIMLTANHLEQEKIKGLIQRVDDYMTKPFSIDEIRIKVHNIIQLREQLRSKYQSSIPEEQISPPINETEQQFWSQLQGVVQKNLDNSDFSAEDFAKAMFMSRMQLHRKLKALTNLSTTLFLRHERLKTAKQMLRKPDAIIANVAYDVGFSSPSFFSKCFKEQFGVTPKEAQEA